MLEMKSISLEENSKSEPESFLALNSKELNSMDRILLIMAYEKRTSIAQYQA